MEFEFDESDLGEDVGGISNPKSPNPKEKEKIMEEIFAEVVETETE